MPRRLWPIGLLLAAGCFPDGRPAAPLVSADPFSNGTLPAPRTTRSAYAAPATEAAARRVMTIGQQVVVANKQLGLCPRFLTIGAPKEEIFHQGTSDIWVTEALVQRCTTDAQLAAVICLELGKMVAEREALTPPDSRESAPPPPFDLSIGNDNSGPNGPADGTRLMELAKYERKHPRDPGPALPVNPEALARKFLERAGYHATDLDAAAPIVQAAEANCTFEKQMNKGAYYLPDQQGHETGAAPNMTLPPAVPVGQPAQVVPPIPTYRP